MGARVLGCVLDNASVVQPRTSTLEAFLSESIILDIISGTKLVPKFREHERKQGSSWRLNVHDLEGPPASHPRGKKKRFRQCTFTDAGVSKLTVGRKLGLRTEPVSLAVVQATLKDGGTYRPVRQIDQRPHINYEYTKEIHGHVSHNRSQDGAAWWEPGLKADVNSDKKCHDIWETRFVFGRDSCE